MKILFISDTHGQHHRLRLPAADMIIHGGDISGMGRKSEVVQFLDWFQSLQYLHKIFIAGNHDFLFERSHREARALVPAGICYLENEAIEIEGIRIYGTPITTEFFNWAFMRKSGEDIQKEWDKIPDKIDFLISHGPPRGILDRNIFGTLCGCPQLLERINHVRPKYVLFGHIHEAYGKVEAGGITFINASVLDENYRLVNDPVLIEYLK